METDLIYPKCHDMENLNLGHLAPEAGLITRKPQHPV